MVCVGAASAHAQWLDSSWRVFVSGGGAARTRTQTTMTRLEPEREDARITDASPTNLHVSAAVFPHRFVGINLELRGETFWGCCDARLPLKRDGQGIVHLPALDASLAALGRVRPTDWLNFEGHLGLQFLARTAVNTENPVMANGQLRQLFVGPMFGVVIAIAPSRFFQAMVFGRFGFGFALGQAQAGGNSLSVGVQAAIGALKVGPLQAGIAPTIEFMGGGATFAVNDTTSREFTQGDVRFGLGISLQQWIPDRVDVPPTEATHTFAGRVVQQDGAAAVDAKVTLDGDATRVTTTDVQGRFTFLAVSKGPHRVEATKESMGPGALEVNVPATAEAVVTLGAPTGPGRITGVVKGPNGPLVATLTTGEVSVKSASDGSYALAKVGPGPVTVKVKADEFNDAEEVAQVAPGGVATLDFTMTPKAVAVQATLRGLIRAKNGEAVKATVRIVELKMKLQVKGDGRFSADVPSGKYTLVIEARGYVTQTKTVEVSGGDQAIFHTELERSR